MKAYIAGINCGKSLRQLKKEVRKQVNEDDYLKGKKRIENKEGDIFEILHGVKFIKDHLVALMLVEGQLMMNDEERSNEILLDAMKLVYLLTLPALNQPSDVPSIIDKNVTELKNCLIAFPNLMPIIVSLIEKPLSVDSSKRGEKGKVIIDLFLEVVRNVLASNNDDLDEEILKIFHRDNVFEVVLHLCNQLDKKGSGEWNLILLEILFNLFRRFDSKKELVGKEKEKENNALKEVRCKQTKFLLLIVAI